MPGEPTTSCGSVRICVSVFFFVPDGATEGARRRKGRRENRSNH
jgi:hypothetical protein